MVCSQYTFAEALKMIDVRLSDIDFQFMLSQYIVMNEDEQIHYMKFIDDVNAW